MKKSVMKDSLIIGFALFAMFFGAGNLIFPPAIGASAGTQWPVAMIATILASVILPILALVAVANVGDDFAAVSKPVGNWYYMFVFLVTITGVVIMANLPRTAATTHELAIAPLFPNIPIQATTIIYFAITLFLVFDKSSLVDRVGKYITPVLLSILVVIIIKGFITPLGTPAETAQTNVFGNAFMELYFTGDLLSGLFFASILSSSINAKGYSDENGRKKMMLRASIVAGILFVFVYGGLLIIGAGAGSLFPADIERTGLLSGIVNHLLGRYGSIGISITVTLACLSTSATLVSVGADFFSSLTKGKISYKVCASIICVVGAFIGTMGVDNIISFAGPVFLAIYPSAIVLTFMALFVRFLPNMGVYKYSVVFALAAGILDSMNALGLSFAGKILSFMPLYSIGFGWILPAVAGFIIGYLVYKFAPPKIQDISVQTDK